MGIDVHDYVIYGRKIQYDDAFLEAYDNDYEKNGDHNTVEVIIDGTCGEYIFIGTILNSSGNHRWGEEGIPFIEIDIGMLPKYEIEYKEKFREAFPDFAHYLNVPFKIIVFTHYS